MPQSNNYNDLPPSLSAKDRLRIGGLIRQFDDKADKLRASVIVYFSFAYIFAWIPYIAIYTYFDCSVSSLAAYVGAIASVAGLLLIKQKKITLAGLIANLGSATALGVIGLTTGNSSSGVLVWLLAVVVGTYIQIGPKYGKLVAGYVLCLLLMNIVPNFIDIPIKYELPFPKNSLEYQIFYIFNLLFCASILVHLINIFNSRYDKAYQALMEAEKRAQESSVAKSEFLANMSHEIRTPMNAILGMTNLVLESEISREDRENLETVQTSTNHLLLLINDLLDLSKIESGKMELFNEDFDLFAELKALLDVLRPRFAEKELQFNTKIAAQVPQYLVGDSMRLRQVLMNLLGNALKFTQTGGVTLNVETLHEEGDEVNVQFSVVDTGIGIPESAQKLIFESFSQADSSTSRTYGGTGLGLTISQQLCRMMGGAVRLDSSSAEGSTFSFTVIFHKGKEVQAPDKVLESINLKGVRLLLVEDNLVNQKLAKKVLEKAGAEVMIAENGLIAIEKLQQQAFQLILMDMQMPVMDGIEATQRIRAGEAGEVGRHIPIIAMTANAFNTDREQCLAAGMQDFVSKPFQKTTLLATISKYL